VEETIRCCVPDLWTVRSVLGKVSAGIKEMEKKIHELMPTQYELRNYKGDSDTWEEVRKGIFI
jgi:hypothetical protein